MMAYREMSSLGCWVIVILSVTSQLHAAPTEAPDTSFSSIVTRWDSNQCSYPDPVFYKEGSVVLPACKSVMPDDPAVDTPDLPNALSLCRKFIEFTDAICAQNSSATLNSIKMEHLVSAASYETLSVCWYAARLPSMFQNWLPEFMKTEESCKELCDAPGDPDKGLPSFQPTCQMMVSSLCMFKANEWPQCINPEERQSVDELLKAEEKEAKDGEAVAETESEIAGGAQQDDKAVPNDAGETTVYGKIEDKKVETVTDKPVTAAQDNNTGVDGNASKVEDTDENDNADTKVADIADGVKDNLVTTAKTPAAGDAVTGPTAAAAAAAAAAAEEKSEKDNATTLSPDAAGADSDKSTADAPSGTLAGLLPPVNGSSVANQSATSGIQAGTYAAAGTEPQPDVQSDEEKDPVEETKVVDVVPSVNGTNTSQNAGNVTPAEKDGEETTPQVDGPATEGKPTGTGPAVVQTTPQNDTGAAVKADIPQQGTTASTNTVVIEQDGTPGAINENKDGAVATLPLPGKDVETPETNENKSEDPTNESEAGEKATTLIQQLPGAATTLPHVLTNNSEVEGGVHTSEGNVDAPKDTDDNNKEPTIPVAPKVEETPEGTEDKKDEKESGEENKPTYPFAQKEDKTAEGDEEKTAEGAEEKTAEGAEEKTAEGAEEKTGEADVEKKTTLFPVVDQGGDVPSIEVEQTPEVRTSTTERTEFETMPRDKLPESKEGFDYGKEDYYNEKDDDEDYSVKDIKKPESYVPREPENNEGENRKPVYNKSPDQPMRMAEGKQNRQLDASVYEDEESPSSGHFFGYFLTAIVICISGYVIFHNKQKIIAFIVEGKGGGRGGGSRRGGGSGPKYSQLSSSVEEVLPSLESATTAKNFVY